jgi:predicted thioesterase
MPTGTLPDHASATATMTVGPTDLASHLGLEPGDVFPPVFATSRMVSLMELAAARTMRPILEAGELSVGVGIEVSHSAATLPGGTVRATAEFLGMDGKLFRFAIVAEDDAGEIGRGTHRRAVVSADGLVERARRRQAAS